MKNLADGSPDMIATMTGWDINPRALGMVPRSQGRATSRACTG